MMMTNSYTARWFDLFLRPIDPQQTAREVTFLRRFLPQPTYTTLLDLCCGTGRHTHLLAAAHYTIIGVDRDLTAISQARAVALPNERYIQHDMRHLRQLDLHADAVLCLWQSFGYFDAPTNQAILQAIAERLPAHGRLILDIYHHDFFAQHQGTRTFERQGTLITETTTLSNRRLQVSLTEDDQQVIDTFEWQLFTPDECVALAQGVQLRCVMLCTNYDEQQVPSASSPRVQYVFEKDAALSHRWVKKNIQEENTCVA
jgi:SAM-dependent methyltransferase